jgi:hypothetical protein
MNGCSAPHLFTRGGATWSPGASDVQPVPCPHGDGGVHQVHSWREGGDVRSLVYCVHPGEIPSGAGERAYGP